MSSQFSYELDERQIRLMMQDAELDYNEALWHKFDEMSVSQAKSASQIGNYIPTINFGISRSVIVPVIFIILIGGLSAMLFSFVDFKKKEAIEKEIPYVAKMEEVKKPTAVIKPIIKAKPIETPVLNAANTIDTNKAVAVKNSVNVVVAPAIKKEEPAKMIEAKPKETILASTVEQKKDIVVPHKRKTNKKVKTEILPTINAPLNLNEGSSEPELELK